MKQIAPVIEYRQIDWPSAAEIHNKEAREQWLEQQVIKTQGHPVLIFEDLPLEIAASLFVSLHRVCPEVSITQRNAGVTVLYDHQTEPFLRAGKSATLPPLEVDRKQETVEFREYTVGRERSLSPARTVLIHAAEHQLLPTLHLIHHLLYIAKHAQLRTENVNTTLW
ncbi:MAG: hypothetical protein Q7S52_04340 [bacterium]|nr:hypothetical protein [bacterium]